MPRVMVGIARKNENSAAAGRSSPSSMPPTMVAPDRDTPGTSASVWQTPTPSARPTGVCSASMHVRTRTLPLDDQHHDPAGDERHGEHGGTRVEHALDEAREERAGDERRDRGDHDRGGEPARRRIGAQPRDDGRNLHAVEPHHGENRAELDHDGEDAVRVAAVPTDARR